MNALNILWSELLSYCEEISKLQSTVRLIFEDKDLEQVFFDTISQHEDLKKKVKKATEEIDDNVIFVSQKEIECANQLVVPPCFGYKKEELDLFDSYEQFHDYVEKTKMVCVGELIVAIVKALVQYNHGVVYVTEGFSSAEDSSYMIWKTCKNPEEFFYFDNAYENQLKELQKHQMICLLEFDRICKKHSIPYSLGGGTLLGAVRHGKVIPWDDDIDVMMMRSDYNRFVKVVNDELGDGFFYQSPKTDSDYHSVFDKIRLNDTLFVTHFSQKLPNLHQGIFIDIFINDRTSANPHFQKLHIFLNLFVRSMVFHKWEGTEMQFYGKMKLFCKIMTVIKNMTPMSILEKIQYFVITMYNKKNTGFLYDGTGEHTRHGAFPEEWVSKIKMGKLGEHEFPIPLNAHEYLVFSYGQDYMKMPAPQNRKATHPIIKLEFLSKKHDNNM